MSFNDTPSLFFIITFPQKMRKNLILSHKVTGSQRDLKFKVSYLLQKEEKYDNEMYSIIIATYTNNLENEYRASIIAEFGDKKYISKKLKLKNGQPFFCYDLSFQDENNNKLKSLDKGIQYNIFNEYIPRQKKEVQEKLHSDTRKSIIQDINKNNLISPNLYFSVLSNLDSKEQFSKYLIDKFDYSIFQIGTFNFGNPLQKSMIETLGTENNSQSNPDIKIGKMSAYYYYFNDRDNFDDHLAKVPLSNEIAESIAENEKSFPQLSEVSENIISFCNNGENIEKILSQSDNINTILGKLDKHSEHISKIVQKENKPLNIKFNKSQIINSDPEQLISNYKTLWNYEKKNNLSLSNLTLNEVIDSYMDGNKGDIQKLKTFKYSVLNNIEGNNKEIKEKINQKIHKSMKELIKQNKMKNSQILDGMNNVDEYYYNKDYDTSKKELDIIDNINVNEIDDEFTEKYRKTNFNVIFKDNFDAFIKKLFEKSQTFNDLSKLINLYDIDNKENIPRIVSKTMEITFVTILEIKTDEKKEMNECFKKIVEIDNASNNNNINEFLDEIEKLNNIATILLLYNYNINNDLFKTNSNLNNVQERMKSFVTDNFIYYIENINIIQSKDKTKFIFTFLNDNYIITEQDFYSTELPLNFQYMTLLNNNNVFTTPKYSSEEYVKKTKEIVKKIQNEFDEGNYEIEKVPDIKAQKNSGILKKKLNAINFGNTKKAEKEEEDGIERINESEKEKEKLNEKKEFYEKFFKEFEMFNKLNNITSNTKIKINEICTFTKNNPYIEEVFEYSSSLTVIEPSKFFQIYLSLSKKKCKEELKVIEITLNKIDELKIIFDNTNPNKEIPVTDEQKEILSKFKDLEELHNEFNILKEHFKIENKNTEQIENSLFISYIEKLIIEDKEIKVDNTNITKQEALFDTNFEKLNLNITITIEENYVYEVKIFLIEDEEPEKLIREVKNIRGKNNDTINIMKDTSFPYKFERNQQIKISIDKFINGLLSENKIIQIPIGTLMVNKNSKQSIFSNELINIKCEEDELSKGRLVTLNFQANGKHFDKEKKVFYTIVNQNKTIFKSNVFAMAYIKPLVLPERLLVPNFDMNLYSSLNNNNEFDKIGTLHTTVKEIKASKTIEIKSDGKVIKMSVQSTIVKYTFIDYIIKMNGRFNVSFAIDFTGSNHIYDRHCFGKDISENYYIKAIKICGGVLDEYSSDHIFPTFGFGAYVNDSTSHCLNVNFKDDPGISTIDNVIQEYQNCLKEIELDGPTLICPVIDNCKKMINNNKSISIYNVLMIITDGIIDDIIEVIDSVVDAQSLPLSINIIGIGEEPTEEMRRLNMELGPLYDSNGKRMDRKVVTYIHFQKYQNNFNMLKNELMKTIPENVIEYLNNFSKMLKP